MGNRTNTKTIKGKINRRLVLLFAVMLMTTSGYLFYSQRKLANGMVVDQAMVLADSYFDNINTLMLTGGMANREIARGKLLSHPEVLDARIVRGRAVIDMYGPGSDYATPKDEYDRRGLTGEALQLFRDGDNGRVLTVVIPMRAQQNYRGVNCLTCHPATPGDVLGVVRVDLSLKKLDGTVQRDLLSNIAINASLMVAGLLIIGALLSRVVSRPITQLGAKMREVAEGHVDLSQRIELHSDDEIGSLAHYFNVAVTKFGQIVEQAHKQSDAATRIKTALDCVSTNVMVADRDYNIIYLNGALQRMFKEAEPQLRQRMAGFQAERLVGQSMDRFHADPDKQRRLLDRLTATHESQLEMGGRTFRIVTNPVINSEGERLGVAVEWDDLTAALQSQGEEQRRLEAERRLAQENALVRSALDNVSSCVMMADCQRKIIYMNKTVQTLFSNAEADIRRQLPDFEAANLMGRSIDDFHRHPSHQAQLLDGLNQRHESELQIGGRTLRIVANPVFSAAGERLGTAVEWADRTQEVAVEREIDSIVDAAGDGDLSKRIEMAGKRGFFLQLGQSVNKLIGVMERVVEDVARVMAALSAGNLTTPITNDYHGTFGRLKNDVNGTIANLENIVQQLRQSTDVIASVSGEIHHGNQQLSRRSVQQATTLEQASHSMSQLTQTVRNNADHAQQANQLAGAARQVAMRGREVIHHAIQAMDAINTSSTKISEIIGVIDGIAFQTNLLALNASVEAARAGEQGRGFAVVANEVRNLAGRSAQAAREIKELILDSVEKIKAGADLVDQSGENLFEIVDGTRKVSDLIAEIAAASAEQSQGLEQVSQAVVAMETTTQQNNALAERTSSASAAMSDQAAEMKGLMAFFSVSKEI